VDQIRIGLIGAGRIGRVHGGNLANLIPQASLVAVADVVEDAAKKLAADLRIPRAYSDPRAILDSQEVDAVIICSSTPTHARLIEDAAGARKQIFCEKPIALDLGAIDRALAAVEKAGVKLQIGFNRRFDPSFRHVRDIVASGKIGTPHILRITSRDPAPPPLSYVKVSGGIFLDMTIHDFDMARFQIGEVDEIYAAGNVLVDPAIGQAGDIDTALITLKFANGALGTIDNSRKAVFGYDQRLEVLCSDGMASAGNKYPDTFSLSDANTIGTSLPLNFFMERYAESFLAEMKAFVAAVMENKAPPVTGRDGRVPVVMGYAAKQSYSENRPVKLSEVM
jgi:myo-inositol 2-dehydrogenase / D-chiro-inositol 1-dehydrogenase